MKKLLVLIMILVCVNGKGQSDSVSSLKFSAVQVDLHELFTYHNDYTIYRQQIKKFVNDDGLLNANLTGYDSSSIGTDLRNYNGGGGFKIFTSLTEKRKYQIDFFFGLYLNTNRINYSTFSKTNYDTLGVVSNGSGMMYEINRNEDIYFFTLTSKQITIPLGFAFNTNKRKRFWGSMGLGISPGITSFYKFTSLNSIFSHTYIVAPNYPQSYYDKLNSQQFTIQNGTYNKTSLKLVGFIGYAYIPCTVNMRISKKVKVLKHLNASISISPGYYLSYDKINRLNHSVSVIVDLGFRYNL